MKLNATMKTHLMRYCSYFDFETIQNPPEGINQARNHKAAMYAYVIDDRNGKVITQRSFAGEDCVQHFLTSILKDWERIRNSEVKYPISMSNEQEEDFQRACNCAQCEVPFKNLKQKHRHHDHSKRYNNYLGALCLLCNLSNRDRNNELTCIAHNGNAFDMMLILKESSPTTRFSILPKSVNEFHEVVVEKYLRFIDSKNFLNGSLDILYYLK